MKKKLTRLLVLILMLSLLLSNIAVAAPVLREPEEPIAPEEPVVPENPEDPETPEDPENPEDPETPEDPEKPEDPEVPDEPVYVYPDDWSRDALVFAVANGILKGDENNNLLPDDYITRAQMAAVLVRMLGATAQTDLSHFTDVPENAWYREELSKAVAAGIFNGATETTMEPESYLTREQTVTVLCRAFGIVGLDPTVYKNFTDGDAISPYARGNVSVLSELKKVNGYPEGDFRPQNPITRAEVAQLVYKLFDVLADTPDQITGGWVLYRGSEALPEELTLDGTLVLAPTSPNKIDASRWELTGDLVICTGADTEAELRGLQADKIVLAAVSGKAYGDSPVVCLTGKGMEYYGEEEIQMLVCSNGSHSVYTNAHEVDVRGGKLTLLADANTVAVENGASVILAGDAYEVDLAENATLATSCTVGFVHVMGLNAKISGSGQLNHLTVHEKCSATVEIYVDELLLGTAALMTLKGNANTITMEFASSLNFHGNAASATLKGRNALHISGVVDQVTLEYDGCILTGSGHIKELIAYGRHHTIGVTYDTFGGTYPGYMQEHDSALEVVQTMRVACDVLRDTFICRNQDLTGYMVKLPKGAVVYNEWHPAGDVFYVSYTDPNGKTWKGWTDRWSCYIPDDTITTDGSLDYSDAVKEGFVDLMGYDSKTEYMVWLSRYTQKVIVFQGSKGNWTVIKTFSCSSGENNTPTPEGVYEIYTRTGRWNFDYYYVDDVSIFSGGHAFHTILMNYDGTVYDGRVGIPLSHGCVRMLPEDCLYIYNLPIGTRVVVY